MRQDNDFFRKIWNLFYHPFNRRPSSDRSCAQTLQYSTCMVELMTPNQTNDPGITFE